MSSKKFTALVFKPVRNKSVKNNRCIWLRHSREQFCNDLQLKRFWQRKPCVGEHTEVSDLATDLASAWPFDDDLILSRPRARATVSCRGHTPAPCSAQQGPLAAAHCSPLIMTYPLSSTSHFHFYLVRVVFRVRWRAGERCEQKKKKGELRGWLRELTRRLTLRGSGVVSAPGHVVCDSCVESEDWGELGGGG